MSDLLLGFVIGITLLGFFNPFKGAYFIIREYQKQVEFLRDGGAERSSQWESGHQVETSEHGPGPPGKETEKAWDEKLMGYRVKVKVGKRTLYSKSYPSHEKALKASHRMRGAKGVIKS
jgi:hypothetical protein